MLDDNAFALLKYLINECQDSSYKILAFSEILDNNKSLTDISTISESLNILMGLGYISVKYTDSEQICLATTKSGRTAVENNAVNGEDQKNYDENKRHGGFWSAFLGGLVGSFFGGIIYFAIRVALNVI